MKLIDWIKDTETNNSEIAKLLGVTSSQIGHIINGHRKPSPKLAKKIFKMTGGNVSIMGLLYPEDH